MISILWRWRTSQVQKNRMTDGRMDFLRVIRESWQRGVLYFGIVSEDFIIAVACIDFFLFCGTGTLFPVYGIISSSIADRGPLHAIVRTSRLTFLVVWRAKRVTQRIDINVQLLWTARNWHLSVPFNLVWIIVLKRETNRDVEVPQTLYYCIFFDSFDDKP